ncbi:MAG: VOC family protein [Bradymonadia bacterium]
MPQRNFLTRFSEDLARDRAWYIELLGYEVAFDSDWFVQLRAPGSELVELGLLARGHALIPEADQHDAARGGMLTVVVDDVDAVHQRAVERGETIVEAPRNLFYGQRRMLVRDPGGMLVDVSSECPPDPEWLASL